MKKEKVYVFYRESFLQSIISDVVTFGFLTFLIWFSHNDTLWTIFCIILYIIMVLGVSNAKKYTYNSIEGLNKFIKKELREKNE